MRFTVNDLRAIASSGGGMVLDTMPFTVNDLRAIASSSSGGNARLTLKNLSRFTVNDLRAIASSGGGCVTFDLSN